MQVYLCEHSIVFEGIINAPQAINKEFELRILINPCVLFGNQRFYLHKSLKALLHPGSQSNRNQLRHDEEEKPCSLKVKPQHQNNGTRMPGYAYCGFITEA